MRNKGPKKSTKIIMYIILFALSLCVTAAGAYLTEIGIMQTIRIVTAVIFGQILVLFGYNAGMMKNDLSGDNADHQVRFLIIYDICILAAFGFTYLPVASWPYVAVFALLVLMSNIPTGIVAGLMCLFISVNFTAQDCNAYFLMYLLCGIMAAVLLGHLDEQFHIALPLIAVETVLTAGLFILVFTQTGEISLDIMLYPIVNAAITLILLFLVLKIYSSKVVFVKSNIYVDINDPEGTVLSELKAISPKDYFKSIHVAYFCDRLAVKLGMDENVLKCAGYYHRVGSITGDNSWENTAAVCADVGLPEEVVGILSEFLADNVQVTKAETAVLYMSECIVSSIIYLFSKDKNMKLEMRSLIEAIFKQRIETGVFNNCDITMKQFEDMKSVFVEEKLYYDFLR